MSKNKEQIAKIKEILAELQAEEEEEVEIISPALMEEVSMETEEEVVEVEEEGKKEEALVNEPPALRCRVIITQRRTGEPEVSVEGDLVAAGGLLEYAKLFLNRAYSQDIEAKMSRREEVQAQEETKEQ